MVPKKSNLFWFFWFFSHWKEYTHFPSQSYKIFCKTCHLPPKQYYSWPTQILQTLLYIQMQNSYQLMTFHTGPVYTDVHWHKYLKDFFKGILLVGWCFEYFVTTRAFAFLAMHSNPFIDEQVHSLFLSKS